MLADGRATNGWLDDRTADPYTYCLQRRFLDAEAKKPMSRLY